MGTPRIYGIRLLPSRHAARRLGLSRAARRSIRRCRETEAGYQPTADGSGVLCVWTRSGSPDRGWSTWDPLGGAGNHEVHRLWIHPLCHHDSAVAVAAFHGYGERVADERWNREPDLAPLDDGQPRQV